jgi:hypothetical protein
VPRATPSDPHSTDATPERNGDAHEPDGPTDTSFDLADLDPEAAGRETTPPKRQLIPGIDLDSAALEEDYEQTCAGGDALTVVVRKASGQGFFRAHPSLYKNVWMMEIKNGADRGFYLIVGEARQLLRRDENDDIKLFPCRLTLCYARDSGLFFWPLRLPEERKKNQIDEWSQTALRICAVAETTWVKMYTRPGGNCYSYKTAEGIAEEPAWPDGITLNELAGIAFENKYITDADDPLVRRLLGKE